jgi:hypothetical protein
MGISDIPLPVSGCRGSVNAFELDETAGISGLRRSSSADTTFVLSFAIMRELLKNPHASLFFFLLQA